MGRLIAAIPCLMLLSAASPARADADARADVVPADEAYCEWVESAAASRAALLVSPDLFGAFGPVAIGSEETGDEFQASADVGWRLTAGVQYRFGNLGRGLLTRKEARARCEEYRAQLGLRQLLEVGLDAGRRPAVEAQLAVIEAALPRGEALVALLEQGLVANVSTIDELYSARLQLDGLRRQAGSLQAELAELEQLPTLQGAWFDERIARYERADDEVERLQGRLRRASSWNVDLRGGYDQLLDAPRDLPVFAQLRVGYNLGGLAQPAADRRALEARDVWRDGAQETPTFRAEALRYQLLAVHEAEQRRLDEVAPLVRDVQAQLDELAQLDTDRAEKVRESLRLDFVKLDAERAYLETHLAALAEGLALDDGVR